MRWGAERAAHAIIAVALGLMALGEGANAQGAADELQWLEPPQSERALAWARTATQRSTEALQASPRYRPLLDELTQLNRSAGQVANITLVGAQAVRLLKKNGSGLANKEEMNFAVNYLNYFGYIGVELLNHLDETELHKSVKGFQRTFGLKQDGIVGPKTLRAMETPRCGCPAR